MWIPVTLAAAVFQILRTSRQHQLRATLSSSAAGFARYLYGLPIATVSSLAVFGLAGRPAPEIPPRFWPWILGAAVAQVVGTVALLQSFRERDFAVGTVFSKSEVLIVAALGAVGVGEALAPAGWIGVVCVAVGVTILSAPSGMAAAWRPATVGLIAGGGFGLAAIGIGEASRSLQGGAAVERALLTLTVLLAVQTVANLAWFALRSPSEITATLAAWRPALLVGLFSMGGSLGWAWAFTLEGAARVRTLGQVELLIAFTVARVVHGERHRPLEYGASALVLAGVVVVAVVG